MLEKIKSTMLWLPQYLIRDFMLKKSNPAAPKHIYLCICDHFEPYWNSGDKKTAKRRLQRWLNEWPKLASEHLDSDGNRLKYSFFYPEEEYVKSDLDLLAELCHDGFGEVEVHLHHDNDTSENLRSTLLDYKYRLHEVHGLLPRSKDTGDITYGFIHGNWALNNSRPDGKMCGINNETQILMETGCYADFTMPSAPDITQTSKVNSIYYAKSLDSPKSHDQGENARAGVNSNGLLMVQGPLGLSWRSPKWGVLPRIENGGLMASTPINAKRVEEWIKHRIHVTDAPDHIFIKLYAHGTQENNLKMFFDEQGGACILEILTDLASSLGSQLHYVSARQMVNVIHSLESGTPSWDEGMLDYRYKLVG